MFNYDANDRFAAGDTYDNDGNTISSGGVANVYDFENHLIQKDGVSIVYDGDGNRAAKTVAGVKTAYIFDDRNPTGYVQVLAEVQGISITRSYVYGLELIEQDRINTSTLRQSTSYNVYDGHGSVRALTDLSGAVTDTYDYDALGNIIHSTGTTPNVYLFAGEQFDPDLHLYYNRARYLNVSTGRFWTMDSFEGYLSEPLSLHKYLYCFATVSCTDPTGYDGDIESFAVYSAADISIKATTLVRVLQLLGAAASLALGYVAAPYINDAFDKYKDRFAPHGFIVAQALVQFWYHFRKWQQDPDFQRQGNHTVSFGLPTGASGTPVVPVASFTVPLPRPLSFKFTFNIYEGGGPGRVFQIDYMIGGNAKLGSGAFIFRLDYLDFQVAPPQYWPHLRYGYGQSGQQPVNVNHEPL